MLADTLGVLEHIELVEACSRSRRNVIPARSKLRVLKAAASCRIPNSVRKFVCIRVSSKHRGG